MLYRLMVTKTDSRASPHERMYAQIMAHYRDTLFETNIGVDVKFPESQLAGCPHLFTIEGLGAVDSTAPSPGRS